MSKMSLSLKDLLEQNVNDALAELERVAPNETARLKLAMAARDAYRKEARAQAKPEASGTLNLMPSNAHDAIVAYLRSVGQPQTKEDIENALINGGFQSDRPRKRFNIRDSFRWHLARPDGTELREISGKIGLKSWIVGSKFVDQDD